MKRINNKGAAMVSVLIATVFIAVLATTLLYMAYLNYLTKAVRNASNDNFYTCEYALDDLATSLQQIAAETTSTADAISAITLACTGSAGSSSGRYDNDKVADIIQLASKVASISVNTTIPTGNNYIVSANSITLQGLVISAQSIDDADPYLANISTDLTLKFNTSSDGGMDVNDFSIITDDTINWCGGGVMVLTGNQFVRAQGWINAHVTRDASGVGSVDSYETNSNDYSDYSRNAIICGYIDHTHGATNGDILSITGDKGIVVGNVCVGAGGTLTITGEMNVVGNIYVMDGGVLMCTKNLKCSGKVYVSGGGVVKGVTSTSQLESASMNIAYVIDADSSGTKAGNGIAANLFSDFYLVYPTAPNSNYVSAPFTAELEEQLHSGAACSKGYETPSALGYFMHTLGQQGVNDSRVEGTDPTGAVNIYFGCTNPLNGLTKPTLLFNIWEPSSPLVVEQSLDATTILSISEVKNKASFQNGIRVSHMSDADYLTARNTLFPYNKYANYFSSLIETKYVTGPNMNTSADGVNANGISGFKSGTISDMMTIVDDWNKGNRGTDAGAVYKHDGSDGVYVLSYPAGKIKAETRYAVYKDGYIYFPYDYFIRPDAGEFITGVFNSFTNVMSPTNTNVAYNNWQKF